MFALARVQLPAPVTLLLPAGRARVGGGTVPGTVPRTVVGFDACFRLNPVTRTIHAELPPMPRPLLIYGPEDFAEACADTPAQHASRVLEILGADPAAVLQALIDGSDVPAPPPRVPREIPNWRAKVVLHGMGLLPAVEAALQSLPEPARTIANLAWNGDAKIARTGALVATIAGILGLTDQQLDTLFRHAAELIV